MQKMIILPNGVAALEGDVMSADVLTRGICQDLMVKADILPLLKQGDWVVDGGAAIGDHTVPYLDAVGENGKVFAFEPIPEFFKCLEYNCRGRGSIFNLALWDEDGVDLFAHIAPGNVGASSVNKNGSSNGVDEVIGPIKTIRLDSMNLDRLDFVKLDTEGSEYFAMLGMEETVRRCKPKIVIEMNPNPAAVHGLTSEDVYKLLDKWGYDHKPIRNSSQKRCPACDILAFPK